jgi:5-formyltetrahydrofolate cyclo-ligase
MQEDYKNNLRKNLLNKRNLLDAESKERYDKRIYSTVINSEEFRRSPNIFVYVSFGSEVDTHKIINYALDQGKNVFVPKIISRKAGMAAVQIKSLGDLERNSFGILEPKDFKDKAGANILDYILVPGLGFDLKGSRLGYGGGFYDRFLKDISAKASVIALAYETQIVESLTVESFDIPVKGIITENGQTLFNE